MATVQSTYENNDDMGQPIYGNDATAFGFAMSNNDLEDGETAGGDGYLDVAPEVAYGDDGEPMYGND